MVKYHKEKYEKKKRSTHVSTGVPSQRVDSEVDVKVELQALGLSICVVYCRGNILCPQFKEYFVVSIIKGAEEVSLFRKTGSKRSG